MSLKVELTIISLEKGDFDGMGQKMEARDNGSFCPKYNFNQYYLILIYLHNKYVSQESFPDANSLGTGLYSMANGMAKIKETNVIAPQPIHAFLALRMAVTLKGYLTEMYLSTASATVNQILTN